MNLKHVILIAVLAHSSLAMSADSSERTTPLDDNPECTERTNIDCVVKDDGTPRRTHPPKKVPASENGTSGPAIASPTVGNSAMGKKLSN